MNDLVQHKFMLGFAEMGKGVHVPDFSKYGFSLLDGEFGVKGRVEIPMLMLWPNKYKPKHMSNLVSRTDSSGNLTGRALIDFRNANEGLQKYLRGINVMPPKKLPVGGLRRVPGP
jgi:hypothetical protein